MLLPDPLAPMIATNSPLGMLSEMERKASTIVSPCLNRLVTRSTRSGSNSVAAGSCELAALAASAVVMVGS